MTLSSTYAKQSHLCYSGATQSVVQRSVRCSAFCPSLTFTIELLNKISTLVLRSTTVTRGDEQMKSPTAQMPGRCRQLYRHFMRQSIILILCITFTTALAAQTRDTSWGNMKDIETDFYSLQVPSNWLDIGKLGLVDQSITMYITNNLR